MEHPVIFWPIWIGYRYLMKFKPLYSYFTFWLRIFCKKKLCFYLNFENFIFLTFFTFSDPQTRDQTKDLGKTKIITIYDKVMSTKLAERHYNMLNFVNLSPLPHLRKFISVPNFPTTFLKLHFHELQGKIKQNSLMLINTELRWV